MFLISCDRTEIRTPQRWTESLNWDGRNQILTQELGRRKSPMFSSAPSCEPLVALRTSQCLDSASEICPEDSEEVFPPTSHNRQPVGRAWCLAQVCLFDDKGGVGAGRKNVLPETFSFGELWILWKRWVALFSTGSGCLLPRPLGSLYLKEQEASLQL